MPVKRNLALYSFFSRHHQEKLVLCQRLGLNNKLQTGERKGLHKGFAQCVRAIIGKKVLKSRSNAIKSVKVNSVSDSAT